MFSNIGNKIKAVAKIFCWIGIILSVVGMISGIIAVASNGILAVVGTIVLGLLCVLGAWIGSFVMYGFGELVNATTEIRNNLKK